MDIQVETGDWRDALTFCRRRFSAAILAPIRFGADILAMRGLGTDFFAQKPAGAETLWRRYTLASDVLDFLATDIFSQFYLFI